jgi:vancomycin resistance protein VanW
MPGVGGGLCNLGNTLHLLVLHSPLTVTEVHYHSDALAPDHGKRVPMSAGTSVSYNYIDFRFRNDTDQPFQLSVKVEGEEMYAALRCLHPIPYDYAITEEGHHFEKDGDTYYRVSKIYRETTDLRTGEVTDKTLIRDNRSEVMFDPAEIPAELLTQ